MTDVPMLPQRERSRRRAESLLPIGSRSPGPCSSRGRSRNCGEDSHTAEAGLAVVGTSQLTGCEFL